MQYYTKMYIGSDKQEIKVAFDTMTPVSMVNSWNCLGCNDDNEEGKGFQYQKSTSIRKISTQKVSFDIEGATAKGVLVSDTFWVNKDDESTSVKEFPFILVNEWTQTRFETTQAVIGLSKTYYAANGESSGPSFLNFLYERGAVNSRVFAVHFDHFGGSTVEFGGYSPEKIVPNVPLTYLELAYKPTWELRINAIRIGEKPTFPNGAMSAFYFPEKIAILDTFSPYISLPSSLASQLYSKIFHEVDEIHLENDLLLGPCDVSKYQSLNLFVNDRYYVKLVPESFVVDIGVRGKCFVPIRFNDDDAFILGEPFFRNFYSVFDDTKGILGIAPSINFVHSSVFEGMVPNDELDYPHATPKNDNSQTLQPQKKPSGVFDAIIQKIT